MMRSEAVRLKARIELGRRPGFELAMISRRDYPNDAAVGDLPALLTLAYSRLRASGSYQMNEKYPKQPGTK